MLYFLTKEMYYNKDKVVVHLNILVMVSNN